MPVIDCETLLRPVTDEAPAGADLSSEYDPAFQELERATQAKPEQQIGNTLIPAEPPNWAFIEAQAPLLLERTKDLRIAAWLAQALLARHGFPAFAEGLALTHGLIEQYWPSLHPQLDPEDSEDPSRKFALSVLCEPSVLALVRATPLLRSRQTGEITLRDVLAAAGDTSIQGARQLEQPFIDGAFQQTELAALEGVLGALQAAVQKLAQIDAAFVSAGATGPDFSALVRALQQASAVLAPRVEQRRGSAPRAEAEAASEAAPVSEGGSVGPAQAPVPRVMGALNSRDDVLRALDAICEYYARHEPSSPLPLLLQRCRRLVPMTFKDIVKDLIPDALAQVELIAGKQED